MLKITQYIHTCIITNTAFQKWPFANISSMKIRERAWYCSGKMAYVPWTQISAPMTYCMENGRQLTAIFITVVPWCLPHLSLGARLRYSRSISPSILRFMTMGSGRNRLCSCEVTYIGLGLEGSDWMLVSCNWYKAGWRKQSKYCVIATKWRIISGPTSVISVVWLRSFLAFMILTMAASILFIQSRVILQHRHNIDTT